ncbi:MAG: hypothetical protein LBI86_09235 [Treponema sp.]|jgi:hypothetical protein|nr:hypothetical protein [Treponema sp.]
MSELKPTLTSSWNEGFNASWIGTYASRYDADYAVSFKIDNDGTYVFSYGEGAVTTYSGKYNKNFSGGVSKSPFRYTVTGLRVINFDKESLTISVNWRLPSGNDTKSFILDRR